MTEDLLTDYEKLKNHLRPLLGGGVVLAFSGGVDSALLLAALAELRSSFPFRLLAVNMHSPLQGDAELREAEHAAAAAGVELTVFDYDPLSLPAIADNPPDRCYHCKREFFSRIIAAAAATGLGTVIDGTNADDLLVYRPGRRSLRELGIKSPLAELGMTKADVRRIAAGLGLSSAARPAAPCLATRFEYGVRLTPELLQRAAAGERILRGFFPEPADLRLRIHAAVIARIEIPPACFSTAVEQHAAISAALRELGFHYVTLDLEGFRSGGMDRLLSPRSPEPAP